MGGLIRLREAAIQALLNHTKPIRVNVSMNAECANHANTTACRK